MPIPPLNEPFEICVRSYPRYNGVRLINLLLTDTATENDYDYIVGSSVVPMPGQTLSVAGMRWRVVAVEIIWTEHLTRWNYRDGVDVPCNQHAVVIVEALT